MYVYIKGILKSKQNTKIILENSGIGYELTIGSMTFNDLPSPPEEVMLYTYHYIREDREELYGFTSLREKDIFEILIGVSNIGPSKAINILSQITPDDFINAVRKEDVLLVSSLKGVGRKSAEKIIIDLKDKFERLPVSEEVAGIDKIKIEESVAGLINLGFKQNIAHDMIRAVKNEITNEDQAQDIIKKALKHV